VGAICILVASFGLSLLAAFNDLRSFEAVATPSLYCWLVLCGVCTAGIVLSVRARRAGLVVPWHFRIALLIGVACGLLSIGPAWRILTKQAAQPVAPLPGEPLDLRNQTIRDRSFAGANLRGATLSGATLRHVNFSGVDLSEADLRNIKMEDVDLSGVRLCGADLRGADLRGARGLESVADWSYAFYNTWRTRLPRSQSFGLEAIPGPIPDTGRDLLYMCQNNVTQRIESGL
jgi:hypothetical protein